MPPIILTCSKALRSLSAFSLLSVSISSYSSWRVDNCCSAFLFAAKREFFWFCRSVSLSWASVRSASADLYCRWIYKIIFLTLIHDAQAYQNIFIMYTTYSIYQICIARCNFPATWHSDECHNYGNGVITCAISETDSNRIHNVMWSIQWNKCHTLWYTNLMVEFQQPTECTHSILYYM